MEVGGWILSHRGCSEKEMFNIFEGTYRDERWGFRRNRYVSLFVDSFIL